MPREQGRRRDARQARYSARAGLVDRRALTQEEARAMFQAIDRSDTRGFGIRQLASVCVDALLAAPAAVGWTETISLLDYASWKDRDSHVLLLLNAGADPSAGALAPGALDRLPRPYAAWVAKAAAAMRRAGADLGAAAGPASKDGPRPPAACACGSTASLRFLPCGHPCCARCPWLPFLRGRAAPPAEEGTEGEEADLCCVPELACPRRCGECQPDSCARR
ncbi:unnamed protein product, partial [Prorocentrum cordatum]